MSSASNTPDKEANDPRGRVNIHVVPTKLEDDENKEKKGVRRLERKGSGGHNFERKGSGGHNLMKFALKRRCSGGSVASSNDNRSIGSLMDIFGGEPKIDDTIDPEDTFAREAPVNRYDPSILTPSSAVIDFDLDGMNDDDSFHQSEHGLDESYEIDEDTGQRLSVPADATDVNKKKGTRSHPMHRYAFPSPSPLCKQVIGVCTIPILMLLSVGLLTFAIKSNLLSASSSQQQSGGSISSLDQLLYNTEMAVNVACTKDSPNWDNLSTCRDLCKESMCCFEISQSKSCYRGNEKSCIAHASCSALKAFPVQMTKPYNNEEEKLQLSEKLLFLCSRSHLDIEMSSCQHFCRNHLCCFEEEDQYNCANIKGEECLVHAACEALVASGN